MDYNVKFHPEQFTAENIKILETDIIKTERFLFVNIFNAICLEVTNS